MPAIQLSVESVEGGGLGCARKSGGRQIERRADVSGALEGAGLVRLGRRTHSEFRRSRSSGERKHCLDATRGFKGTSIRSARITLSVEPEQKRAIARRARALGISVSELLRRAALSYAGPGADVALRERAETARAAKGEGEEREVRLLAEELARAVARTERKLDVALARVAELEAFMQRREEFRAEIRRELESGFAEETAPEFPA